MCCYVGMRVSTIVQPQEPVLTRYEETNIVKMDDMINGTEDYLPSSEYNWGRRQVSNRNKKSYKRECEGVYVCSCGLVYKKKRNMSL